MAFVLALALSYPPDLAAELGRFPPPCVAEASAELARAHYEWVSGRVALTDDLAGRDERYAYRRAAEWRADLWYYLAAAHDPGNCDFARDVWLSMLRDGLPEGWYEVGRMPAPMPVMDDIWR